MENVELKAGDAVKLRPEAKFSSGGLIPDSLKRSKLYIKEIRKNGKCAISTTPNGSVSGVVNMEFLVPYSAVIIEDGFNPYLINVIIDDLNVYSNNRNTAKVTGTIHKNEVYTIVSEKSGWGKLKSGLGWINLEFTEKL